MIIAVATRTGMLLAHHPVDQRHRCATVAGRDVCRRCLVLYPLMVAAMVAVAAGIGADAVPVGWREGWLWLLPLPGAVDYTAEAFGQWTYSARRQVLVTALQGIGGGAGLAWEVQAPATVSFWSAALFYGISGLVVTGLGWQFRAQHRASAAYRASLDEAEARLGP
ncbi:MAG: hypothetical protein ACKV2O_02260 [Acidimicrobiales bacterium]